jgi:hypothetical protein
MKRILLSLAIALCATQMVFAQQKPASLTSDTEAGANATVSMTEMQEQMNSMAATLQANQEQMAELRAEIKELKAMVNTANRAAEAPPGAPANVVVAQPPAESITPTTGATAPTASVASAAGGDPDPHAPQTAGPVTAPLNNMVESVMPGLKISGVVWLYSYEPLGLPGSNPSFDLYGLHLMLDRHTDGPIGFHVEYRLRTTKLRSFFTGPTWAQQAYMDVKVPGGTLKLGEVYKQYGIFTDYSFYGGLPYFDGLKYDPEWGASYEGDNKLTDRVSLAHDIQYFRTDARVNGSEPGRDVVSDPTAHRLNEFVARVVPTVKLTDKIALGVGPSFEVGQVIHTAAATNDYWRFGGEATLDVGPVKLYGEVIRQNFNGPSFAYLPKVTYATVGLNSNITPWLSTHINFGQGNYSPGAGLPVRGQEQIIQPGLVFNLAKGYAIYTEYTYWPLHPTPGVTNFFDRSFNTVFYIAF